MEKWFTGTHLIYVDIVCSIDVDLREAGFPRYSPLKGVREYPWLGERDWWPPFNKSHDSPELIGGKPAAWQQRLSGQAAWRPLAERISLCCYLQILNEACIKPPIHFTTTQHSIILCIYKIELKDSALSLANWFRKYFHVMKHLICISICIIDCQIGLATAPALFPVYLLVGWICI